MVEFPLTQTGQEVQDILDQVPLNTQEIENVRTESTDYTDAETTRAQGIEESLQQQIDEIVGGGATVSLSANPATIFVGIQRTISLSATTNRNATLIQIKKGSTILATGSGGSLAASDSVTPATASTISYSAEFVISGVTRTASRNVNAVYPIYYGAGMQQSDVLDVEGCKANPATTPTGTYNVTVTGSPKYIWFFVPANMTTQITSAKMNGFDFPLETLPNTTDASGVAYRVYRTPNTQEEGEYPIVINPSN